MSDPKWELVDEGDGFERGQFDRICKDLRWSALFNIAQGLRMASMLGVKGASYTDMTAVYANECAKAAELHARNEQALKARDMLILCGERELDGIPADDTAARCRALIDGLIVQRQRAETAEACLRALQAKARLA